MAITEILHLPHVLVSGDGFNSAYGETHVSLRVTVRYSGDERDVTTVQATDLFTGEIYDGDELHRRADLLGRAHVADEIDVAIERYEATGNTGTPCHCMRCSAAPLARAA